jgi:hypothetical protein
MQKISTFLLAVLISTTSFSQNKAEAALKVLDEKYPQEKLHVFLNKENFVAGEKVWFKAWLFSGYVTSYISTHLYVELYNAKKELLDSLSVPLLNATATGSFSLPARLAEGVYYLRAYTKWMQNFDEKFDYKTSFLVYNPGSQKSLKLKPVQWTAMVFPESGRMLSGVENKIAVRLKTNGSLPEKWEGFVADRSDPSNKLVSFTSHNPQVASFYFTPESGHAYFMKLTDGSGKDTTINLPAANTGTAIKTDLVGEQLFIKLFFRGMPEAGLNYKVLAEMQNQVIYSAIIRNKNAEVNTSIPSAKLQTGILHITLFDDKENAVAERLVFIDKQKIQPEIIGDSLYSKPRGYNRAFIISDSFMSYSYAVSVTDGRMATSRSRNIYSDLYLGDLTSSIHQPGWYFEGEEKQEALDALLISEKWERFDWAKIMKGEYPAISFQPEKYLQFNGVATRRGQPIQNEMLPVMMQFKDSTIQFTQITTDKDGRFELRNVAFYDTVKLFYKVKKTGATELVDFDVRQNNRFFQRFGNMSFPEPSYFVSDRRSGEPQPAFVTQTLTALDNEKKQEKRYVELTEVQVRSNARAATQRLSDELSSGLFKSAGNEKTFDLSNLTEAASYANIFEWLEGRVAGLGFRSPTESELSGMDNNPNSQTSLLKPGDKVPVIRNVDATVYIDETPTDIYVLNTLPVNDIAMVKVIPGYFAGASGGGGGGGVIAIYTKKGDAKRDANPLLAKSILVGYNRTESFNTINYFEANPSETDTRIQLYWNSNPYNERGIRIPVRFFNNDGSQRYRITVTGLTKDLQPVFIDKEFVPAK